VNSADSIAGTENKVYLKIDYYNELYGLFASDEYISSDSILLADSSIMNDIWLDNELLSIAPDGAVEARLAIVFEQVGDAGGAVYVDGVQFGFVGVPEPSAAILMAIAGLGMISRRRK
jgi:hypothetical protein